MPATPRILRPRNKAVQVNQAAPLQIVTSAFSGAAGTLLTEFKSPLILEEAGGAQCWVNQGYLLANDGTQGQLARADAHGIVNKAWYAGTGFAAPPDAFVKDLEVVCYGYLSWTGANPGAAYVRLVAAWAETQNIQPYFDGRRLAVGDFRNATAWAGGATPMAEAGRLSILAPIKALVDPRAHRLRVSQLVQPITALRVLAMSNQLGQHSATAWWCGPLKLVLTYYDTPPDYQAASELQVAKDAGFTQFEVNANMPDRVENRRRYVLGPWRLKVGDAPASTKRYARYRVQDQAGIWSSWSPTVEFDLLTDQAARMVEDASMKPIALAEMELGIWLEANRWVKYEVSATQTYRIALDRSKFPIETWFVKDLEIDGVRQGATQQSRIADVENTENSFMFDETGDASQPPNYLYFRPKAPLRHPAGAGEGNALGCMLVVVFPMANHTVTTGPTGDVPYLPIVAGIPTIEDTVSGFREGRGATPSGPLRLHNVQMTGWHLNDPQDPKSKPLWWRLLQLAQPNPGVGMMASRRRLTIRMLPQGGRYSDAVVVFTGGVALEGATLSANEVSLRAYGWELQAKEAELGARRASRTEYPNLPESSVGKVYQHVFGAGHKRLEAFVVDPTAAALLSSGENLSTVDVLYMDGAVYPETFTFDAARQEIKLTGPSAATHITESHTWEFDGNGEKLVPWDGSPATATTRSGALFKRLLSAMGVPDFEVLAEAFNWLDDPAATDEWPSALITAEVRCVFSSPTSALNALRVLEETRAVHVRRRGDGLLEPVPVYPAELDEHSISIDRFDVLTRNPFEVDTSEMLTQRVIEYMGYVDPYQAVSEAVYSTFLTFPRWGLQATVRIPTMHVNAAGADALNAHLQAVVDWAREPKLRTTLPVLNRALVVPPGTPVVVNLAEGPDESGALTWSLWKVEKVAVGIDGVTGMTAVRIFPTMALPLRSEDAVP